MERGSDWAGTSPGTASGASRTVPQRLHVTPRTLQIALGLLWILDGGLKFQPDLFKPSFVADVVPPMAVGQPGLLASTIDNMAKAQCPTGASCSGMPTPTCAGGTTPV